MTQRVSFDTKLLNTSNKTARDMDTWLAANVGLDNYNLIDPYNPRIITVEFRSVEDALAFKLRFQV